MEVMVERRDQELSYSAIQVNDTPQSTVSSAYL